MYIVDSDTALIKIHRSDCGLFQDTAMKFEVGHAGKLWNATFVVMDNKKTFFTLRIQRLGVQMTMTLMT